MARMIGGEIVGTGFGADDAPVPLPRWPLHIDRAWAAAVLRDLTALAQTLPSLKALIDSPGFNRTTLQAWVTSLNARSESARLVADALQTKMDSMPDDGF